MTPAARAQRPPTIAPIAGVFFKSMHGTLNHLLTTDWVWMHRFTGQGPSPERLDAIPGTSACPTWRTARETEDRRIVAYGPTALDDADLAGSIRYRRVSHARGVRPVTDAGARSFLQPPDPSSRPGTLRAVQLRPAAALVLDLLNYQREVGRR